MLRTSGERIPCWALHGMCSIGGSGNMQLNYLFSYHFLIYEDECLTSPCILAKIVYKKNDPWEQWTHTLRQNSWNVINLQWMIEVTKALSYYQNFILQGLSSLAPMMYVCIKSWYCQTLSLQKSVGKFLPSFMSIILLKEDWEFVQMVMQLASVAQLDAHPAGDQEAAGSAPAEVGNILSWRLIMKYFLQSFSPFCWFKKGRRQFLAKECAQYWLTT